MIAEPAAYGATAPPAIVDVNEIGLDLGHQVVDLPGPSYPMHGLRPQRFGRERGKAVGSLDASLAVGERGPAGILEPVDPRGVRRRMAGSSAPKPR